MDASRISATTFPLVDRSLDDALTVLEQAGLKNVDLMERMPHMSLDPNECNLAEVAACAAAHGIRIANLATYVGDTLQSEDEKEQEAGYQDVIRAIDAAEKLGARSIRGFRSPKFDAPEGVPRMVPWAKKCAEYAAGKGIYMGLENHGGGISGDPEVCRDLAAQVGSPYFGVLYDPCNLITRGTDYKEGLEVMKDHIVHVHIKDGTNEERSQEKTMLGDGDVDVPWILQRLEEIGYDGYITLEYECKTEPPDTGLKKWFDTLAAM